MIVAVEVTKDTVELISDEDDDDSFIALTHQQLAALAEYVRTHPVTKHGWATTIPEDGDMSGKWECTCGCLEVVALSVSE